MRLLGEANPEFVVALVVIVVVPFAVPTPSLGGLSLLLVFPADLLRCRIASTAGSGARRLRSSTRCSLRSQQAEGA